MCCKIKKSRHDFQTMAMSPSHNHGASRALLRHFTVQKDIFIPTFNVHLRKNLTIEWIERGIAQNQTSDTLTCERGLQFYNRINRLQFVFCNSNVFVLILEFGLLCRAMSMLLLQNRYLFASMWQFSSSLEIEWEQFAPNWTQSKLTHLIVWCHTHVHCACFLRWNFNINIHSVLA